MAVIAALAVAMVWPVLLFPTCSTVLVVTLQRFGFTLLAICILLSVLGFVVGMLSGFLYWLR
jgi:hypothetical protein